MWHWLPSVLYNKSTFYFSAKRLFFLQLVVIVFSAHFLIVLLSFFISWLEKDNQKFNVSLLQHHATYVLMPLQKKVLQKEQAVKNSSKVHTKSQVIDHETYLAKKKAKKETHIQSGKISKSTLSSTKARLSEPKKVGTHAVVAPKDKVSLVAKAELSKTKNVKKSKEPILAAEIVDIEIVSVPALPIKDVESKNELLENAAIQNLQKDNEISTQKAEIIDLKVDESLDNFDEDNVVFVGYEELEQCMIASKIAQKVQESWKAPVGITKDVSCDVSVKVGADGVGLNAKVIKSSGIFVYDLSARKALLKIEYPKEVWNKTITIALGSS